MNTEEKRAQSAAIRPELQVGVWTDEGEIIYRQNNVTDTMYIIVKRSDFTQAPQVLWFNLEGKPIPSLHVSGTTSESASTDVVVWPRGKCEYYWELSKSEQEAFMFGQDCREGLTDEDQAEYDDLSTSEQEAFEMGQMTDDEWEPYTGDDAWLNDL
jgi:hypothetical protein